MNKQLGLEFYSSYLYRSMAAYCHLKNLKGFGEWLDTQANEEMNHGMKIYKYLLDRGAQVKLPKIDEPPSDFKSVLAVFEMAYEHEKNMVSASIDKIYKTALDENDYPTQIFLQWFISEQVEEEANASEMVEKLKMLGDKMSSILVLDHHAGKRGK